MKKMEELQRLKILKVIIRILKTVNDCKCILTDAESFLKGRRLFFDHAFRINPTEGNNNLYVTHQFNYENKFFEYNQATVLSTVGTSISKTIWRIICNKWYQ